MALQKNSCARAWLVVPLAAATVFGLNVRHRAESPLTGRGSMAYTIINNIVDHYMTFAVQAEADMDAVSVELKDVLAREKIRDCLARIARGEDRRDAAALRDCYWSDATVDFGVFSGTFEEYLAWVVPGSPAVLLTQHVLGQSLIELRAERAVAETHVLSYHRIDMGESERDMVLGGRYLDQLERRGAEWRVAQRTMLYDWVQALGASADWSHGLLGTPFRADHFTGRAIGDFSESLFGKDPRARGSKA